MRLSGVQQEQTIPIAPDLKIQPLHQGLGISPTLQTLLFDALQMAGTWHHTPATAHPMPQQTAPSGCIQGTQLPDRERTRPGTARPLQVFHGQSIRQRLEFRTDPGRAGKGRGGGRPPLLQQRQDLMAQEIAIEPQILIAWVFYPAQALAFGVVVQLCATDLEKGARQPTGTEATQSRHGRQSSRSAAAQQLQQQGLRLIIPMLCCQQHISWRHLSG
jgi:hypothetical protein